MSHRPSRLSYRFSFPDQCLQRGEWLHRTGALQDLEHSRVGAFGLDGKVPDRLVQVMERDCFDGIQGKQNLDQSAYEVPK